MANDRVIIKNVKFMVTRQEMEVFLQSAIPQVRVTNIHINRAGMRYNTNPYCQVFVSLATDVEARLVVSELHGGLFRPISQKRLHCEMAVPRMASMHRRVKVKARVWIHD